MIEKFFPPKFTAGSPKPDNVSVPQAPLKEYLKSREFWMAVGIFFGGGLLLLIITLTLLLPLLTRHNQETEVPDVTGMSFRKAADLLSEAGLDVEVSDSVYKPDLKPLAVDHQDPSALSIVKPGRTIFLRVNKMQPPMVKLPNIFEESFEHARDILVNWKLRVGNVTYVASSFNNLVIGAYFKGQALKKDTPVPEGAKIDLKVSSWNVAQKIPIPDLVGKDFQAALNEITSLGLIPVPQFRLSTRAEKELEVYQQEPRFKEGKKDSITVGSQLIIFVNHDGPPVMGEGGKIISRNNEEDPELQEENPKDSKDKKDKKSKSEKNERKD